MRIVHVAEVTLGGIGTYLEEIAGYQNGAFGASNVFFLLPEGSERQLPSIDPGQIVPFRYKGRSPSSLASFGMQAAKAIRRIEPDVVHLHSTFAGAVLRPLLRTMRRRPKVVYCPHGWAFGMEVSNLKRLLYAEFERMLTRHTDLIVVNSDAEKRLGTHYRIDPKRILTVKNGISTQGPRAARSAEPLSGPIQAAFIGRFEQQKGLDILLDVFETLPEGALHLHLVGAGSVVGKGGPGRLKRPNITAHGWLPRAEVVALLSRVDVVVMPSRWEAQGLVALEAMRSGLPVIASDRGGLPEVIRDGIDGYIFDLDDPEALGRRMLSLDRPELRRMGENARLRYESEYTAERMNILLHRAYQKVLGQGLDAHGALPVHPTEPGYDRGVGSNGLVLDPANDA